MRPRIFRISKRLWHKNVGNVGKLWEKLNLTSVAHVVSLQLLEASGETLKTRRRVQRASEVKWR